MRFYENGTFIGHLYHDASEGLLRLETGSAWLTLETSTGDIGINTDNPAAAFHIKQPGTAISDGIRLETSLATAEDWYIYMDTTDDLTFRNDGTN